MTRLETAMKRFSAALERLETSVSAYVQTTGNGSADPDVVALRARIVALEEESRDITGLTEEVEVRLDGAIAEIRSVLDRN
jgi:hypothetical protein